MTSLDSVEIYMTPDDFLRAITPNMQQPNGRAFQNCYIDANQYMIYLEFTCLFIYNNLIILLNITKFY